MRHCPFSNYHVQVSLQVWGVDWRLRQGYKVFVIMATYECW
jgi:hypothetical protein